MTQTENKPEYKTACGGKLKEPSNFPNPFNPTTTIGYQVPVAARVTIKIYDMIGRETATLADETVDAGAYSVVWDSKDAEGRSAASGMYIYRMLAVPLDASAQPVFSVAKKLMLMK